MTAVAETPHATLPTVAPVAFMLPRSQAILTKLIAPVSEGGFGVPAAVLIPAGSSVGTGTAGTLISQLLTSLLPLLTSCIVPATPAALLTAFHNAADPGDAGIPARSAIASAARTQIIDNAANLRDRLRLMAVLFQPLCAAVVQSCGTMQPADVTAMLAEYNAQTGAAA